MTERKTVRVTIFHQQYTLAATDQDGEIESLAEEVDDLMVEIAKQAGNVDSNRVAVLACLELIDRLRTAEREHSQLQAHLDGKTREFASLLDDALRK
jgi:cell division protein ZapA (FtsZ GTPase activity inhibitor)